MSPVRKRRLVVPLTMASIGTALAIASWIGNGWASGLGVGLVTVVATIAYYVLGARDTDLGAMFGSRADERQITISTRATVLMANVLVITALGGAIISTAAGALVWPFLLFAALGGATYFAGLALYRNH
jgi:hypothetical protein